MGPVGWHTHGWYCLGFPKDREVTYLLPRNVRAVVFAFQFAYTVNPSKLARKSLYFSYDRQKRLSMFSTIHFLVSIPVSNILGGGGGGGGRGVAWTN
jgi:hypothetical protein